MELWPWDPNLLVIEKMTKAEIVRLANEHILKERARCARLVAELAAKWVMSEPGELSPELWPAKIREG